MFAVKHHNVGFGVVHPDNGVECGHEGVSFVQVKKG